MRPCLGEENAVKRCRDMYVVKPRIACLEIVSIPNPLVSYSNSPVYFVSRSRLHCGEEFRIPIISNNNYKTNIKIDSRYLEGDKPPNCSTLLTLGLWKVQVPIVCDDDLKTHGVLVFWVAQLSWKTQGDESNITKNNQRSNCSWIFTPG